MGTVDNSNKIMVCANGIVNNSSKTSHVLACGVRAQTLISWAPQEVGTKPGL